MFISPLNEDTISSEHSVLIQHIEKTIQTDHQQTSHSHNQSLITSTNQQDLEQTYSFNHQHQSNVIYN